MLRRMTARSSPSSRATGQTWRRRRPTCLRCVRRASTAQAVLSLGSSPHLALELGVCALWRLSSHVTLCYLLQVMPLMPSLEHKLRLCSLMASLQHRLKEIEQVCRATRGRAAPIGPARTHLPWGHAFCITLLTPCPCCCAGGQGGVLGKQGGPREQLHAAAA